MIITKHGRLYKELDKQLCICPNCDCEFVFFKMDVQTYLNEEPYVICPERFNAIKLTNVEVKVK